MNKISIIIPTINREKELYNTIKYIYLQLFVEFEIIIIDQNKVFNLHYYKKIISTFNNINIKVIKQEQPNASKARNRGAKLSKNKILLFIDDDVVIKSKLFLYNHLKNYKNSSIYIVAGKVIDYPFLTRKRKILRNNFYFFSLNSDQKIKIYGIGRSCNLSIRKKTYFDLGGMDENFINGAHKEETDLLFRAKRKKIRVLFDPKSNLIHLKNKQGGIRSFNPLTKIFYSMYGDLYFSIKHLFNSNLFLNIYFFLRRFFLNKDSINFFSFVLKIIMFFPSFLYAIFIIIKNFKF